MTGGVLAGSLTVVLALGAATARAETTAPLVLRGGAAPAGLDLPVVLRGQAAPAATTAMAEPAAMPLVVGGERLWLVDQAGGRIVACRLEQGVMVDRLRVRCAEADGRPWF